MKLRQASFVTRSLLFFAVVFAAGTILVPQRSKAENRPLSIRFATYGDITRSAESTQLNRFARALGSNGGAQGCIITYGGRHSVGDVAQERADRARDYLVNVRDIDAARLVTIDGGYRETPNTELWIVPAGATPPTASPTVER